MTGDEGSAVADRIFSILWLCVCAVIGYQMWMLEVPFAYEPVGPKAFPAILAVLMSVCCLFLFCYPDRLKVLPETPVVLKGVLLIGVLFTYATLFDIAGYPVATFFMLFFAARIFGGSALSGIILGLAVGGLGWLLFDRVLEVSLPLGWIRG